MIRRSKDLQKITNGEFGGIVGPFDDKIINYITNEIVNDILSHISIKKAGIMMTFIG